MNAQTTVALVDIKKAEAVDLAIESDFALHPSELVCDGKVNDAGYTSQDLRNAIPAHCFRSSYVKSFSYLARDLLVTGWLVWLAYTRIPLINSTWLRAVLWAAYGYVQGQQMTGLWVLGHEAGHGAFAPGGFINNLVGWILHSALMTPYFSWRSTHRKHHIYANNLVKDTNYVPPELNKYAELLGVNLHEVAEMTEDSPVYTVGRLVLQQILGFPYYLLTSITAAQGSLAPGRTMDPASKLPLSKSHWNPFSSLFRPEEFLTIVASDIGVGLAMASVYYAAQRFGWPLIALLYIQPYVWVNHWLIHITYLHHTHPDVPKYEPEAWTFLKGATATIDRNFGFTGRHLMHNVAEYHVVHHLFSRIPHYHLKEATMSIKPLLGESYHEDKQRSPWVGLWESFTKCHYVAPSNPSAKPEDRTMIYKSGSSLSPELAMGRGGLPVERYLLWFRAQLRLE